MGLLRVLATGIPIPNDAWKPFLRFTVEDIKQQDVSMLAVEGNKDYQEATLAQLEARWAAYQLVEKSILSLSYTPQAVLFGGLHDIHAAVVECPSGSVISFQLGIRKTESTCHMGTRIHRVTLLEDCLVVTKWGQHIQEVYTGPGQHVMFVSEGVREGITVCGSNDSIGQWQPENTKGQVTLFVKKDMAVIPVALDEPQSSLLEFKLLLMTENGLEWEAPPFKNKSVILPKHEDAVVCSRWSHEATYVTELTKVPLTEQIKVPDIPDAMDWSVRKSQSLPECPTARITYSKTSNDDESPAVLDLASGDGGKGDVAITTDESFVDISWVFQEDETPLTKGKTGWPAIVRRVRRILLVFKCCRGNKSAERENGRSV